VNAEAGGTSVGGVVEFRQFEALVAVAEERHLGRAAARLGIAVSSLSERLTRLERSSGLTLVERSTRRVGLTAAGAGVLDAARAVVEAWSAARGRMAEVQQQRAGVIRIAVVNDADACARDLTAALRRRLPRFTVEATAMSSRDAKQALYHREIEASVIAGFPHAPRCRWNQAERPTRVRFVGRPRARDLVVQWRASWSGPAANALAEVAHCRQRDAIRAASPPGDPWLRAREFLRGPPGSAPVQTMSTLAPAVHAGLAPGLPAPARASPESLAVGLDAEELDALEIDFDARGFAPDTVRE
jgi:DNA-binding transcriptional LysR family regulator